MSDMDIHEDSESQLKCIKCKERLHGSLNVIQTDSEKTFVLWNKYQILLYEDLNFDSVPKEFTPDFQINQIIVSSNYLVCVDRNGNVHTTSLKFKNSGQKRFKSSFQPREQGVLYCIRYSPESTLSLKINSETYYLCLHKINADFQLEKEIILKVDDRDGLLNSTFKKSKSEYILVCQAISKEGFNSLSHYFQEQLWRNHSLVIISFDKLTVYACLFCQKDPQEVICSKKLYTSPSEICDIKIFGKENLKIIIGLTCGTLVQLPLNNNNKTPDVVHLNTALSKFIALNDSVIYTDSLTMWKAENINSKENINFQQFFVKHVNNFIKYDGQLICTTYTNFIYIFPIENKSSYFEQNNELYCPAEKLLNNSECLFKINQEIEINKEIINQINEEGKHLTAASLSRRQDVIDKMIKVEAIVYENYEEVIKDNSEITLTEELHKYFQPELILILVKISATVIQHNLSSILTNILENIKIHFTLSSEGKVLKTTTIELVEPLKNLQVLMPLEAHDVTQLNIEIQLVSVIPGALDRKETIWTVLHRKVITLNAEQFIKTSLSNNKCVNLKEPKNNMNEIICKTAINQHGDLFHITDHSKCNQEINLPFYVKLPITYKEFLTNDETFIKYIHPQKAKYILKLLSSEEFLKSKSNIFVEIGNEKVSIEILNDDFSNPLMKISCDNVKTACEIRNFFAKVFYDDIKNSDEEFISNALYTATENLQKGLKLCSSLEECLLLAERLQKNVIANLPL